MSVDFSSEDTVVLKAIYRLQWEPAQDAHVLLYPEGMVTLNGSASEILQLCQGELNISELINALEEKFPEAGELRGDVLAFLKEAKNNGWIESK